MPAAAAARTQNEPPPPRATTSLRCRLRLPDGCSLAQRPLRAFRALQAKQVGAFLINSHSGCDSWNIDEARTFLRGALAIEEEVGVPIVHETHRRRLFWNPFNFRDILKGQPDLIDVKINLDVSHWVVCTSTGARSCLAGAAARRAHRPVLWPYHTTPGVG